MRGRWGDKVSYIEQILQMDEDNHTHSVSKCMSSLILFKNHLRKALSAYIFLTQKMVPTFKKILKLHAKHHAVI